MDSEGLCEWAMEMKSGGKINGVLVNLFLDL